METLISFAILAPAATKGTLGKIPAFYFQSGGLCYCRERFLLELGDNCVDCYRSIFELLHPNHVCGVAMDRSLVYRGSTCGCEGDF